MKYRKLPKGQEEISILGFGGSSIHESDMEKYISGGVLDHILDLKKQGVVHRIGLSSHTPSIVNMFLDKGILDVVMFSINPAYDYRHGEYANGSVDERMELYRRCEKEKVGITVMKPFGGGRLLDAKLSPFGRSLTRHQCIQYALDKPGVLNVLPGYRNREDLMDVLGFLDASEEERDHYRKLERHAEDCIQCGHCNKRCPFKADQMGRMKEIAEYFGI